MSHAIAILRRGGSQAEFLSLIHDATAALGAIGGDPTTTLQDSVAICAASLGAYEADSLLVRDAGIVSVGGDPVVPFQNGRNYAASIDYVGTCLATQDFDPLSICRGTFNAVGIFPDSRCVAAATDKMGIRSVFYVVNERFGIISTSMWAAAIMLGSRLTPDPVARLQLASSGFIAGNATPYREMKSLLPSQCLVISPTNYSQRTYWNWGKACRHTASVSADVSEFHEIFRDAIKLRLGTDSTALAQLSGGLDSRAVVAGIRSFGTAVYSVGFGRPGTMDHSLAPKAAHALGTQHLQVPAVGPSVQTSTAPAFRSLRRSLKGKPIARPRQVWTGDDGSILVGHVYADLTTTVLDPLSTCDRVHALLADTKWAIPNGVLKPRFTDLTRRTAAKDLVSLTADVAYADSVRQTHYMVMQTRHRFVLYDHLETLFFQGFEPVLPFCDSEVIKWVLSRPGPPFQFHQFYNLWAERLGTAFCSVPWQPYPGRKAGPAGLPPDLRTQWQERDLSPKLSQRIRTVLTLLQLCTMDPYLRSSVSFPRLVATTAMELIGSEHFAWEEKRLNRLSQPMSPYLQVKRWLDSCGD